MNKEDYSKYYIQGSEHYLIPKDVFDELFNEMVNWKEESKELKRKLNEAIHKATEFESEVYELKKQLEEKNNPQIFIDTQDMEERYAEGLYQEHLEKENIKYKNQQKEFINYLEDEIKRINPKELDIGELNLRLNDIKFTQYLIYKEILQKYKEIIGGKE